MRCEIMACRRNSSPTRCRVTAPPIRFTIGTWIAAGWSGWRDTLGRRTAFLALILPVALSQAAPPPRPYHVEHYDVKLEVDIAEKRLVGEVAIRFRSLVANLSELELDAGELEVSSVAEGRFSRQGRTLGVSLKRSMKLGGQGKLTIRYRAKPAKGLVFFPGQVYTSFFTLE